MFKTQSITFFNQRQTAERWQLIPVYTTENCWHCSGENGTGSPQKGSAWIKLAV